MATLKTSIVRHDFTPLDIGHGGLTFGDVVMKRIEQALAEGEMLEGVELLFENDEWREMQRAYVEDRSVHAVPKRAK